jgi:hypothetical protein
MERNISEMIMTLLSAPARGFASLAPLHQNHSTDNQNRRANKAEWLQRKPEPVKHQHVSQAHGKGRNDHDKE